MLIFLLRFEEYCGVFRPDITRHYSKPVQHTIHTRITSILDWINSWIYDGNCGIESELPSTIGEQQLVTEVVVTEEVVTIADGVTEGSETTVGPDDEY